jgi:hypothetical protein
MTVGIAAIAESQGDPYVVVAADRMVTVGEQGGIEFEGNESKIAPFVENGDLTAFAVGAGSTTYIDELLDTIQAIMEGLDFRPTSTRDALNIVQSAYQTTIRDTIQNQLLAPFGYDIKHLRDGEAVIPAQIQAGIFERATNIREGIGEGVHILVAAVGNDGGGIYLLAGGDFQNYTRMGYWVIGSGADSAGLSLIRRQYNHRAPLREGIFTVLEAKDQAEERQGVGQQMDMVIGWPNGMYTFDENEKKDMRDQLEVIKSKEQQARESVMDKWELPF